MSKTFVRSTTPKITPFLWLENRAEEAAQFYASVFPNAEVLHTDPQVSTVRLEGQEFHLFNGGPHFRLSPAFSIFVQCQTQSEIDDLWTKLTADGGEDSNCGWLKDKYGVSWQLCPPILLEYLNDPDPEKASRVRNAMLEMNKLDIAALQRAYDGRAQ
jgi:predicted 3-demethylubiquinone-9 3-methyltransferase (glyoxalase superfamily)